jgi:hypothetical protein
LDERWSETNYSPLLLSSFDIKFFICKVQYSVLEKRVSAQHCGSISLILQTLWGALPSKSQVHNKPHYGPLSRLDGCRKKAPDQKIFSFFAFRDAPRLLSHFLLAHIKKEQKAQEVSLDKTGWQAG